MAAEIDMYDSSPITFSPDGRLYQVEYAREAVKRGSPVVGITYKDGVVIISARPKGSRIYDKMPNMKVHLISDAIIAGTSGLVADSRVMMDYSRTVCTRYRMTYEDDMSVMELTYKIGDLMQYYTQFSGYRPIGLAMLLGGFIAGYPVLFEVDPSGTIIPYWADAIGHGRTEIMEFLETFYEKEIGLDDAMVLGIKALNEVYPVIKNTDEFIFEAGYVKCLRRGERESGYIDINKYMKKLG